MIYYYKNAMIYYYKVYNAVDLYSLIAITCNLAESVTVVIDYYGYIVLCGF